MTGPERRPIEPDAGAPARSSTGVVLAVVLLLGGVGAYLLLRTSRGPDSTGPNPGARLQDLAPESGLDFKMSFLPNEQGENFKINLYDHGCGVAVSDYDGDGDDDLYFCNQLGSNALFENDGKGHFSDVTKAAGPLALEDRISVAATFGDADGDGDQDLYVTTTRAGNVFFKNRGDGTFEDATKAAGLELVAHSEQPTFFDADGDGDLDLLVTNTAHWTTDTFDEKARYYVGGPDLFALIDSKIEKNNFYRNRGDATFEDVTEEAGLAGAGWGGDTAVFDYDEDGDLDLFVANMFGSSSLFANDGKGRFTNVTKEVLGKTSWGTVGAKAFDYDGDGRLDLFLVDMHSDMWMPARTPPNQIPLARKFASPFGAQTEADIQRDPDLVKWRDRLNYKVEDVIFGNTLFHALGGGKFEEVSDRAGVETLWPWGVAAGDFDGDGFLDAYLPTGMGHPYGYVRSPLLMNNRNGTFTDRSVEVGTAFPRGGQTLPGRYSTGAPAKSARSAAVGDFDRDGRLDLIVNNFNDRPWLYMNRFPARPWVGFSLTGTKSNRDALGAVVKLTVGGRTMVRQVDPAGGYLAQSSRTLHFALGDATTVDRAEIRWPSGTVQTLDRVEAGRVHAVKEP